jgi:prolyl 4-hydroxylase
MIDPALTEIVIEGALGGSNKKSIRSCLINMIGMKPQEADQLLGQLPFRKKPWLINYLNFYTLKINKKARKFNFPFTQIYKYNHFLKDDVCDELIKTADKITRKSSVSNAEGTTLLSDYRTSSTADMKCTENKIVGWIDIEIARALGIKYSLGETLQIQKYCPGEYYKEHHDYFTWNTEEYKTYTEWMGQRTWTFMVYLNDVDKGGETYFKHLGLKIKPKKGTAILWNNLNPFGIPNKKTMHEALPTINGNKYVITKWWRSWSLID